MDAEQNTDGCTTYHCDKRGLVTLANFTARIIEEQIFIDGNAKERFYIISGRNANGPFENIKINADDLGAMAWPANAWGNDAIMFPVAGCQNLLRTDIQVNSTPTKVTIYTATGWQKINGKDAFLTNKTAIFAKERKTNIRIELPKDLKCYELPATVDNDAVKRGLDAALRLTSILPPEIGWTILGAIFRSVLTASDFAIHITGRTGTYKSEIAAIVQSFFGSCTARELPASWSSTANALELLAYRAKDVMMVIDDFIPGGSTYQQKAYQQNADRVIRGQGNQGGRARMDSTSRIQTTMYPRGIIFSTGEDTPEGHSVRARMMIAELSPGDISTERLTEAQKAREDYSHLTAAFIQWLAEDLPGKRQKAKEIATQVRDKFIAIGHARTPQMLGELHAGIFLLLQFAHKIGMTKDEVNAHWRNSTTNLVTIGKRQIEYLQNADPADQFIGVLRSMFAAQSAHVIGINKGLPRNASVLGWSTSGEGDDLAFKPHGPKLGWVDDEAGILYLDANMAYDAIKKHSRGTVTINKNTLYKRLREAEYLARWDTARQRNTCRVKCEGAQRTVLALTLNMITESEEK